ncbi:HNH endonuclease [Brucella sp. H1_1004]|uniref:HNH endonuclease n=1 Tax=Brucella sp. H1_1004 TaxID=3110109 RepID=UPI0039B3F28E
MARREFSKSVYAEIVKRAMQPNGDIACEGCGLILGKRKYHIDHIKADALEIDKSAKLTAKDGQLLGVECCHKEKTRQDVAVISEAKRREEKHLGIKRPKGTIKSAGFPKFEKSGHIDKSALPPLPLSRLMQSGIARTRP